MQGFALLPSLATALPAALAPLAAAQTVHVVDAAGGPGSAFTEISAAVAQASDGDLVLVRSGTYAGFEIDGKSLSIVADDGHDVVVDAGTVGLGIVNLGAGQEVLLRGIDLVTHPLAGFPGFGIGGNDGHVWVEDGSFAGVNLVVGGGGSTAFVRSILDSSGAGAVAGIWSSDARVQVLVSSVGTSIVPEPDRGILVNGGEVFVLGGEVRGGPGLDGGACEPGGPGGTGLELDGGVARLGGVFLAGGPGGKGGPCVGGGSAPDGLVGTKLDVQEGVLEVLPVASFPPRVEASSPVRAGQPVHLEYHGSHFEDVFLLVSPRQLHEFVPSVHSTLLVAQPEILFLGHIDTGSTIQASFPTSPLPPGVEFVQVFAQPLVFEFGSSVVLGGATAVTILSPVF